MREATIPPCPGSGNMPGNSLHTATPSWRIRDSSTLEGFRQLMSSPRWITSCWRCVGRACRACAASASMPLRWMKASAELAMVDGGGTACGAGGGRGCGGASAGGGGRCGGCGGIWASMVRMREINTAEGFLQLLKSLATICLWASGGRARSMWQTVSSMPLRARYSSTAPPCCTWFRTAWMREMTTAEGLRAFEGRASMTCCCSMGDSARSSAAHLSSRPNSWM
mmetsp:Transcript_91531/g.267840  ORF Transcript_91531/g.267840 Transcript_91531/m.267840 type:complete len:225 (-) Transcript_91531:230-904(-)